MNGKQFAKWALGTAVVLAALLIGLVVIVDPFFRFRTCSTAYPV